MTVSTTTEKTHQLAQWIREANSVVALTGAGISVPSGIPDFRTPGTGLWENVDPMEVAHIDVFRHDPKRFWHFYGARFASLGDKKPNGAHTALAELEERGLLDAVITQNIDRLHYEAGTRRLVEVHGSIEISRCMVCGNKYELEWVLAQCAEGTIPACESCAEKWPVKPDVVLFGEMLPEAALGEAYTLSSQADLMLAIGSSLAVHPVAGLPELTLRGGGRLVLVTHGPTPYDSHAALKLEGDVEHELAALIAALGS